MFTAKRTNKEVTEALLNYYARPVKNSVNYRGYVAGGYPKALFDKMWAMIHQEKLTKNSSIAIINDIALEGTFYLFQKGYENITIICTNDKIFDYVLNAKCYLYNINVEVILLGDVKNMKFDLVIANPPFSIGNEITKSIIDNVEFDQFINLMPASKYRKGQLFQYVEYIIQCKDSFEDASIGDSLTLSRIKKNTKVFSDYDTFCNEFRDKEFVEFYKLNSKVKHKYPYAYASLFFKGCDDAAKTQAKEKMNDYYSNMSHTFCCTWRTVENGTHKTKNCFDYTWNILENPDIDQVIHTSEKVNQTCITVDFIEMHTSSEKKNLARFWYNNPLMNSLLKGLNKSSGTAQIAIPSIDFSKDRDYEHLTLEDIMNILREENPDVA